MMCPAESISRAQRANFTRSCSFGDSKIPSTCDEHDFEKPGWFPLAEIAAVGAKDDDHPFCSAAEALTRQEPFVNKNLAYQALGMLTQLLRHGSVSYQGGFCNFTIGQLVPLPIRAVTATVR